jgi:protein-S-isoprenylcysteine O-methyltransferase Ste14
MVKDIGADPEVIYSDQRPTQRFFSKFSRLLSVFIGLIIFMHMAGFSGHGDDATVHLFNPFILSVLGYAIGLLGLFLCWKSQQTMGRAWRVGIDTQATTELITTGVFTKIRNPTYSGLFLICLGALMLIHNALILIWVVAFYISIEFQVRIEEEHLTEIHGQTYSDYLNATQRYLPYVY